MTIETLNTLIQMIANIAVIISLVFVVLQVRMGLKMLRDAAVRNHNEKHQSISRAVFENPQLAELWTRGSKSGLAGLSDAERAQFVNFYMYVLRVWEELYLQHRNGAMNEALFAANVQILRDTYPMPGAREAWMVRRHLFTPEFQNFYETYATSGEARPLYDTTSSAPQSAE
jgi:hypothetical protein